MIVVVNEVSTPAEARAAVERMAAQGIGHVKMWVDDRRGTYPKMTPEVYTTRSAVVATRRTSSGPPLGGAMPGMNNNRDAGGYFPARWSR